MSGRQAARAAGERSEPVRRCSGNATGARQLQRLVGRRASCRGRRGKNTELSESCEVIGNASLPDCLSVAEFQYDDLVELNPLSGWRKDTPTTGLRARDREASYDNWAFRDEVVEFLVVVRKGFPRSLDHTSDGRMTFLEGRIRPIVGDVVRSVEVRDAVESATVPDVLCKFADDRLVVVGLFTHSSRSTDRRSAASALMAMLPHRVAPSEGRGRRRVTRTSADEERWI